MILTNKFAYARADDIIPSMSGVVCIISFGSKETAVHVEAKLKNYGFSTEVINIKKCVHLTDISEYLISNNKKISSVERIYLRDNRKDQAAIVSMQKNIIDTIITQKKDCSFFFIEDDSSPESFYFKKTMFQLRKMFFSFGHIGNDQTVYAMQGSLDIGFHHNIFKNFTTDDYLSKKTRTIPFNGSIAVEAPPDTIPIRYLLHFRSPQAFVKNVIRTLDCFYKEKRHPSIFISNPVRPYNSYSTSTRAFQIESLLGKRSLPFSDSSELPKGTTVLTWSTKRFFTLLKQGHRPLPLTKCLASTIFPLRKKNLSELIIFNPDSEKICRLENFIFESNFEKYAETLYKKLKKL